MPRTDVLTTLKQQAEAMRFFSPDLPVAFRTSHAALDLLGALNAESGGTLAQMPLSTRAAVAVQPLPPNPEPHLRIRSLQMAPPIGNPEVVIPLRAAPAPAPPERWAMPLLALWQLLQPQMPGAAILIHSEIPQNAGQASSTALLAAAALALNSLENRPAPSPQAVAQSVASAEAIVRHGTPRVVASPGHIIAASTCLYPRPARPVLLRYSAQPNRFVGPVPLPESVRVLALDTGVRYTQTQATLDEIRTAGAMGMRIIETIYRDLGQPHTPLHGYLANTSPLLYRQYFRTLLPRRLRGSDFIRTYGPLPEYLPPDIAEDLDHARLYRVRTAVDHLIAEHEHAEQFLQAMEEIADSAPPAPPPPPAPVTHTKEAELLLQRAGRLLLASHHSYRLRLELSCREADWLVDRLMEAGTERGIYGARITGTGGGGTVAALLSRSADSTDALLEVMKAYNHVTGLVLSVAEG
jgi:L-arabinokinase